MGVPFTCLSRTQAEQQLQSAFIKYRYIYNIPIEMCVYEDLSRYYRKSLYPAKEQIDSAVTLWYRIAQDYDAKCRLACFLEHDLEKLQSYQQAAARCRAMSYAMFASRRERPSQETIEEFNRNSFYELLVYQLIAAGEWNIVRSMTRHSLFFSALLSGDVEKVRDILDVFSDEDKDAGPDHRLSRLLPVYDAMVEGNAEEFASQLLKRVEHYRKGPPAAQPAVDAVSVALCKIARKYKIDYLPPIAEVPSIFLTKTARHRPDCRLPDEDYCQQVFNAWGDKIPGILEVRQRLYFMDKNGRYPPW